jgi:tetratricopeptide (TPR) repeat protein
MARLLFREYSDDSALVFARMALHLNPNLTESRILLAGLMARHERIDDAIAYYNAISPEESIYVDARRQSAELLEQDKRYEEAVALLSRLFEEKGDISALIMVGDIYRRQDKFQDAVNAYNKAATVVGTPIPEKYWDLLYSRGMAYERLGDNARAEDDLKAAIAFKPNHPYLLNYLGYSWVDQGKNLDESLALIEQAVALRPNDGYIADSLGWAFYRMGHYDSAVTHLEGASEMEPYDSVINDHLGDAYWQVGRKLEAQFQWTRALNHSDDEKLSAEIKVKLDEGLANIPAAVPSVKEAKAVDPDTASP